MTEDTITYLTIRRFQNNKELICEEIEQMKALKYIPLKSKQQIVKSKLSKDSKLH
jgi:hypothetical protein